jgi:hypothetical protein
MLVIPLLLTTAGSVLFGYGVRDTLSWVSLFFGYGMISVALTAVRHLISTTVVMACSD